ncbi:predicted protein [Histoplasma mississippiense (nom. inval.)]|uniref:predicted protein n=1 Tax=Ajellomyces capsulatus (strain NAm1 / WU24) TaxID=2059318 RepID=UPI000157B301|nr:predicted protein [Histoplasma mississippiense (nom. inval.)]EDN02183.1 predicted protein [Histoplasma mississippiense (nom. inval.)]
MHHEAVILSAIDDLNAQLVPNYTVTAEKYGISRYTLSRRYRGVQTSRKEATSIHRKILTDSQENRLLFHINRLADRGFPCTPQILHNLVVEILKEPIGANWVARFCQRHKDVINYRKRSLNTILNLGISTTSMKKDSYWASSTPLKRIVSINALKSGRTIGASQDGSREFITLLASICADGTSLPPALIYQGESRDIQDTWLEDFDSKKDQVYFAASENGWSNDEYGLMWLKKIFEPHTKKKAGRGYRLLILDGHSSHVNMAFINYAAQHKILLAVFPPHSTHRLQPLDVGIFGPLSKSYSKHLNERMRTDAQYRPRNQERRRRKRGRAMGLLDSSNPSLAQFFSPAKVQSIREQMTAAEAAKKDEQARKEDAKLQHAILKEQKETDIMLQRMEREAARQAAKEQKEMDKAARAAQRQIDRELRDAKKAQEQKEKEERAAARQQSRLGGAQVARGSAAGGGGKIAGVECRRALSG